ncbi:hypothetical protein CEXT_781991 [Caerostris extrusa]|uniref:Uncharacterized protein n=1 Tax=Caerostris extrusa TaxID=172846 RepID=A0AAV4VEN0_CAEEX|nr:hypothetical protein CEXT_781991 [Caerostris extrusa]
MVLFFAVGLGFWIRQNSSLVTVVGSSRGIGKFKMYSRYDLVLGWFIFSNLSDLVWIFGFVRIPRWFVGSSDMVLFFAEGLGFSIRQNSLVPLVGSSRGIVKLSDLFEIWFCSWLA